MYPSNSWLSKYRKQENKQHIVVFDFREVCIFMFALNMCTTLVVSVWPLVAQAPASAVSQADGYGFGSLLAVSLS